MSRSCSSRERWARRWRSTASKRGATDYVLKHRLPRLVPAVRRALQEVQDRRERTLAENEVRRLNAALEIALGQATSFLDSIIENLPDMVYVKDARELRFVRFNRACEQLFGIDRAHLIGRTAGELFPPAVATAYEESDRMALQERRIVDLPEEIVPTRQLGPRVLHTRKMPIFGPSGEPRHVLCISRDVTEHRTAEENARISKLEAERANRAKSDFLSRMSHDLRTPLNAVLGFAQLLELEELPIEQADSVRQILTGGQHLLELINEVLDIARIESGQLSLSPEPVDVPDIVRHVVQLIRPLAAARGIVVSVAGGGDPPVFARADRQRLTQILLNFLGNAVKYNRLGGSVSVQAAVMGESTVRISVADTGPGIPSEKLALLFTPFERLGRNRARWRAPASDWRSRRDLPKPWADRSACSPKSIVDPRSGSSCRGRARRPTAKRRRKTRGLQPARRPMPSRRAPSSTSRTTIRTSACSSAC